MHVAVDTLGHLLTLLVTPANEQDRAQAGELAQGVQQATGQSVELAFVNQGYTEDAPAPIHALQLESLTASRKFGRCYLTHRHNLVYPITNGRQD